MKLRKKDAIIILSLVFLSLWVRLSTLMMVHTGVDERDYWFAAKAISQGLPYPELSHRTVRWAVILPVALAQSLFGPHPNAYYVMPLLAALSQAVLVYLLGRALNGRLAGSLASIALTFFPYQIRAASQVRPEIFSMTYVLLAALALVRYVRSSSDRARISAAVLAALATFLAYEAKITNLFFMPGIAIAILLYSKGKGLRDALAYGGVLAGLYLAETAAYAALTPYALGHLAVIASHHLSSEFASPLGGFLDLFTRYAPENLELYWSIPFLAFAALAFMSFAPRRPAAFARAGDPATKAVTLASLSFFLFVTFAVTSVDPLLPAEDFINRYFCAVLPLVLAVLASAASDAIARFPSARATFARAFSGWRAPAASLILCGLVTLAFSLPIVPRSVRPFAHTPLRAGDHPLALNSEYRALVTRAYDEGTPIVAADGNGGMNAALTATYFFLDESRYSGGRPPSPTKGLSGDVPVYVVSRDSGNAALTGDALFVVRNPFRARSFDAKRAAELDSDGFPKDN